MHFKQILVVKETHENEKRIALTPQKVSLLVSKGRRVLVEAGAGLSAGFTDSDYIQSGAEIYSLNISGFPPNTLIVRVLRPSKERELMEYKLFHENTAMLGFLFPFVPDNHIAAWQALGLTTLSFDLFKSLSIYDPKNAQAAMSRIAGRLAFYGALNHYRGKLPIKLTVLGTGAAATRAAFEALKNHIPVQVFGRREYYRAELEAAGMTYFVLPEEGNQADAIKPYLFEQSIIIAAARTPGKKAPLLIDEESLMLLPANAVVVDLAISNGGNVVGSKYDQCITVENGVTIMNVSGYPKAEPKTSSEVYADCVWSLLEEIMSEEGEVLFENKLVQEIWVTHHKKRHDSLYADFKCNEKE